MTMDIIDKRIYSCNEAICKNIESLQANERGLLSQNILSQLRNFLECVFLKIYVASGNSLIENEYQNIKNAIKFINTLQGKYRFLMSRHFFKLATTALVVGLVSACAQAGVDPATLPVKNLKVDVIFVGAGGTGLAVAVAARLAGAEVLVIEKLPMVGGSSLLRVGPLLLEIPMLRSELEARGPRPRSLSRSGSMTRSAPPRAAIPPILMRVLCAPWPESLR